MKNDRDFTVKFLLQLLIKCASFYVCCVYQEQIEQEKVVSTNLNERYACGVGVCKQELWIPWWIALGKSKVFKIEQQLRETLGA